MQLSRFVLPAVLVIGSAVPFLAPTAAQAHEGPRHEVRHHRRHHEYRVMYRRGPRAAWCCYGRFDGREAARCAAERLRCQGFVVCVER